MHRIDADGHVANMFSDGNPAGGVPGTRVDDDWSNAVQEELCNVVETCGGTLAKGTNNQVIGQCVSAATANKIMRRDASGRAKVADGSAADDIATKGQLDALAAPVTGTFTYSNGWAAESGVLTQVKRSAGIVTFCVQIIGTTSHAWDSLVSFPDGFRPSGQLRFWGDVQLSSGSKYPAMFRLSSGGLIYADLYFNGTGFVSLPAPTGTELAHVSGSFHV